MGISMIQAKALSPRTAPKPATRRSAKFSLGRFTRNQEGATAVEFGFVAMPFLALMLAIVETALAFWTATVLDTAVTDASRRLYTGQFQQETESIKKPEELATKFRDELCKSIVALFTCSKIKTDVRVLASFTDKVEPPPVMDGALNPAFGGYEAAGPNQIVVVRAAAEFPVFLSLLYPNQTNLTNGNRLVMGTSAFRTEPYGQ
jgi:Flp pilus assembly protein TadG